MQSVETYRRASAGVASAPRMDVTERSIVVSRRVIAMHYVRRRKAVQRRCRSATTIQFDCSGTGDGEPTESHAKY